MRSLRGRLLLAVGTVVIVSIAAVGVLTSFGTRRELQHMVEVETRTETPRELDLAGVAERLESYHDRGESWDGAVALLDDLRGQVAGRDLLLMGPDGELLGSTSADLAPGEVRVGDDGDLWIERTGDDAEGTISSSARLRMPWRPLHGAGGERIGSVHLLPEVPLETGPAPEVRLQRSLNRWIWFAVLGGGLLALLATAAIARRIVGPVERLTQAVRRMADGDRALRVPVDSADEVGELARAFNRMAEALERQERLRRQMVTDVAHDLRTPLTNIRGQLEAIEDGLLPPSAEVIASLQEEVLFLGNLVRDLQELSLAEAGQLRLDPQPLSVEAEVARVVDVLRPAGMAGGPAIDVVATEVPPVVADADRFRQVVRNLLTNALAHAGPDGQVTVSARASGGEVEVTVRDDGPGIPPEHLPHVFERFYRADEARARGGGGAGLGLAIVRQLVEAQGGRVWVESTPGAGAAFFFTVPVSASVPASGS